MNIKDFFKQSAEIDVMLSAAINIESELAGTLTGDDLRLFMDYRSLCTMIIKLILENGE